MPHRLILHFDIADRQRELRDTVAPDDFLLMRRETELPFPRGTLAYCVDKQAERVLYSVHGENLAGLFDAPFLYGEQLNQATGVVSVPYERLTEIEPEHCAPAPTLVFSPGRTGSTLLARLLRAIGQGCASEPDMPTQICRFGREDRRRIGLPMEAALQRACIVSLAQAVGPSPFIKLRSHCNARPLPMLEAVPGARAIFMLRNRHAWARSRHRAFGEPPASIAAILREAMDAVDKLGGAGVPFGIVWFEDLRRDPLRVLRDSLSLPDADAAAVHATMARDAQAGTAVARSRLAGQAVQDGFAAAFDAAWEAARQGAQWSPETLALVRDIDDRAP